MSLMNIIEPTDIKSDVIGPSLSFTFVVYTDVHGTLDVFFY